MVGSSDCRIFFEPETMVRGEAPSISWVARKTCAEVEVAAIEDARSALPIFVMVCVFFVLDSLLPAQCMRQGCYDFCDPMSFPMQVIHTPIDYHYVAGLPVLDNERLEDLLR
mmetsp:Transcript_30866/g.57156  ORF Transcript_30866/g.57156 Transcript_30866/m.57156 type:complete len:112 (-) Transcript_30866:175-510(-)